MTLIEIVSRFEARGLRCQWRGEEVRCQCSGHGGTDLNLAMSVGTTGKIVATCHSHDCSLQEIAAGVGLRVSDFSAGQHQSNGSDRAAERVVARYRYSDARGNLAFEVWRYDPKDFRPFHLNAAGQWIKGDPPGIKKPLYRLPELLAADPKEPVFICAGEKDADNVARLGLVATTNPGGESPHWDRRPEWLEPLQGRRCLILEDCDPVNPKTGKRPGEEHGRQVFTALTNAGIEAKRLLLPGLQEGQDASDWIGRGGTAAQLRELARPEPPKLFARVMTFTQLLEQPPPQWLIEGMFFEETMIELFGEPNSGKSFVVIDEAIALRRGGEWCGRKINRPGPVLYVNADGGRGFSDRARAWVEIHGRIEAPHEFWTLPEAVNLCRQQDMADLMALIRYLPECPVMVVFDTYSRCIPGVNENLQEFASQVVEHLDRLRLEFHASVKLVHHTDLSGQHARGSSVIIGACDTQARVEKSADNIVSVTCEKQRDAAYFDPLYFQLGRIEGTNAVWLTQREDGPTEDRSDRKESGINKVLDAIRRDPGITRHVLALGLDIHERTIRRYVETLILRSQVVETDLPGEWGHHPPKGLFAL